MKTKILLAVVSAALLVSITSVVTAETKTEKASPTPKPTGACTITTYGITPTCTSGMHRDSCYALGTKTGSMADWAEGKSCPKK